MPFMHDEGATNPSANRTFTEVLAARLSRRSVLAGGAATAAAGLLGGVGPSAGLFTPMTGAVGKPGALLGFKAVEPSEADDVVVPDGYTVEVMIPWGTPLRSDGPAWKKDGTSSAADQAMQIGSNHDGMHYFPWDGEGNVRGILCLNHEYYDPILFFPDGNENFDADKALKGQNAHGVSVVEIRDLGGTWGPVDSRYNRRITGNTPMTFSGPAAGHDLLKTAADPTGMEVLGTLNNCANGWTPWATYLTCEENFNGYFMNMGEGEVSAAQAELFDRYGVSDEDAGYLWATVDERFRADLNPNEPNRFGWVVEINPWVPSSKPVKRTALGRMKHEGATPVVNPEGRVVVYMGDDERFDYLYKFVSAGHWREMLDNDTSPLDEGTQYVARFADDGTGEWLPLVHGGGPLTATNGFADQGEVLVKTRLAADAVGATKMDRPEWVAMSPTRDMFVALTNNTNRTPEEVDAANPRAENAFGHILHWVEADRDATSTTFEWDVFVLAGAGESSGDGSTVAAEAAFGSPDGLWVDDDGRVWILTDGSQPIDCNNQLLVADPWTKEVRRFLVGPKGCEVTGIHTTPDQRTLFVNIQHPGEDAEDPANPTQQSSWPDHDPAGRPRSATLVIRKADGGKVGT